jgi:transposase
MLRVRRFLCPNVACKRRTFSEPLRGLVAPHARRTRRLAAAQGRVAVATGGEAGARLLGHLGMPASPSTLLRLVRRLPLPARSRPRALGVDDWAIRKGRTYGTILVDLERHRVVDLLPDRTAAMLADWLRRHRGVRILARDRSTEYARGMAAGAPRARQVADRWHLLLNVRQMAERWLATVHGRLRRLPVVAATPGLPARRAKAFPRSRAEIAAGADSRARRLALYDEIRRRHAAGEPLLAISRRMELARSTVRRYAKAGSFPERAARRPGPSMIDPHLAHLEARHAAGCENALALWRELRERGFPGTHRQVSRWVQQRRRTPAKTGPRCERRQDQAAELPVTGPTAAALPPPKQLAWLLVKQPAALDADETAALACIGRDPEAAEVAGLVRRFVDLVRRDGGGANSPRRALATLKAWLRDACASGVQAVATFAAGLRQDGAAICAALTTPWSNGQPEGHITKLKLLKRQMYGRAHFDLLRRRMLLAA